MCFFDRSYLHHDVLLYQKETGASEASMFGVDEAQDLLALNEGGQLESLFGHQVDQRTVNVDDLAWRRATMRGSIFLGFSLIRGSPSYAAFRREKSRP